MTLFKKKLKANSKIEFFEAMDAKPKFARYASIINSMPFNVKKGKEERMLRNKQGAISSN